MRTTIRYKSWLPRCHVDEAGALLGTYPLENAPMPPCVVCGGTDIMLEQTRMGDWWRCGNAECASWDSDMPEYADGFFNEAMLWAHEANAWSVVRT